MNRILFIGACDKSDLLIYISKILTTGGYKVLLLDATYSGIYQYAVSQVSKLKICEHDGFDIATGFDGFAYDESYDYVLIDIDHESLLPHIGEFESCVLVANYERRTIVMNQLLLKTLHELHAHRTLSLCKVIYHTDCHLDEAYLDTTLDSLAVTWIEPTVTFYYDEYDYAVKLSNQFASKVKLKGLSRSYRRNLLELTRSVSGLEEKLLRKTLNNAIRRKLS